MPQPNRDGRRSKVNPERRADERRKSQERRNPSGHGMQVTPAQQEAVAKSQEHAGDAERPVAEIDESLLKELKD